MSGQIMDYTNNLEEESPLSPDSNFQNKCDSDQLTGFTAMSINTPCPVDHFDRWAKINFGQSEQVD